MRCSRPTIDSAAFTVLLALPPHQVARLLETQAVGTTDRDLQQATADVLGEVYFRQGRSHAHGLDVELTDTEQFAFELC
ncbi:hypothetical protein NC315_37825 [Streptomyces sp. G2]|uniref:hypothetical protein n=1 Tax=Streptomyces sp. G2 TaxID=1684471 RepID=UPI00202E65C8|nr:hypothetical protein [Streptomyces sp. G2]MCM1951075.1 hypothetical protein [Streptomyces sp. G2]